MAFAVEEIPDEANLFRRIHETHVTPEGDISSAAFKQERLSVNWEKYSTAESTADENSLAVALLPCKGCRELNQTVEHTPIEAGQPFGPNQAHAEVCGNKSKSIAKRLKDMTKTVWRKPSPGTMRSG